MFGLLSLEVSARRLVPVMATCLLFGACAQRNDITTTAPPRESPESTLGGDDRGGVAPIDRPASEDDEDDERLIALTPARRMRLGLHLPSGTVPGLSAQQWSDPEAVASRFVLADTTYTAAEDPIAVNARRGAYATPRLAADLATSSSGGARLEDLRHSQARFVGEVLTIGTDHQDGELAVVQIRAAVTTTRSGEPPVRRVRFYQLTLRRDLVDGRWLVAGVEQS